MDISEITKLNNSVFKYLESFSEDCTENEACKVSENLNKYFDLLPNLSKEYMMHFISLCSASVYPKTLVFITEHCETLYKKILDSISN